MTKEQKVELEDTAPAEDLPTQDDVAAELAKLGKELVAVAGDKLAREAKLKEVEIVLGRLQVKDFPELAESEVIQNFAKMFMGELRPGEIRNRGTLAEAAREWTMEDINRMIRDGNMGLRTFVPPETMKIIWNGVELAIIADGTPVEVPDCFFAEYMRVIYAKRQAGIHERYLLGFSDQLPDPNWQTPETAAVRAWSVQGKDRGIRGTLGVGPIIIEQGEEAAS